MSALPADATESGEPTDFTSGVYSFLNALPEHMLRRLYSTPASSLAIFRLLPLVARHLVLNMLWVEGPLPRLEVEMWAGRPKDGKKHLNDSLARLGRLHIVREAAIADGRPSTSADPGTVLILEASFRDSFRRALTGGGDSGSFGVPVKSVGVASVSVDQLDAYATEQWETILHYMVGSEVQRRPSQRVLAMLERSGLMIAASPKAKQMQITSRGFQFLLEDVNTQLWDLLLQYLSIAESSDMDIVDVLTCLFMLGSLELGRQYTNEGLSATQEQVLSDLADYGLVMRSELGRFYPTRLATTLTSSAPPLVASHHASDDRGFLILETNYRTYAYTSNPLQIAVLNLFTTLRYRFPNLVVGAITRESVKAALANGITASQIVAYLSTHAHPQMRRQDPLLPPTVVDQIRLWELEKNRIRDQEGYLYEDFKSTADYDLVVQYARQLGVTVWDDPDARKFFVSADGHHILREFIKRRMAGAA